ncbi:hypothetical protein PoB_002456200 [Plakobranchus ocellatus]|uniref:Uncharacterized protein n=1 Tax=Plakobranchus ocellatus TaxID=259542 RepID=A0AAV3ZSD0_9GAST|nr:hypothetical protein PoB_002456200 [Plakobranchus ocellatus]
MIRTPRVARWTSLHPNPQKGCTDCLSNRLDKGSLVKMVRSRPFPHHACYCVFSHRHQFRHGAAPKSLDTPRDRRQPMGSCLHPMSCLPAVCLCVCVRCAIDEARL